LKACIGATPGWRPTDFPRREYKNTNYTLFIDHTSCIICIFLIIFLSHLFLLTNYFIFYIIINQSITKYVQKSTFYVILNWSLTQNKFKIAQTFKNWMLYFIPGERSKWEICILQGTKEQGNFHRASGIMNTKLVKWLWYF
jgi:hypothetical protein